LDEHVAGVDLAIDEVDDIAVQLGVS